VGERERLAQHVPGRRPGRLVAVVQPRLDELEVPVAQLAEDEAVEAERGLGEVEAGDPLGRVGLRGLQAREDPAVLDRGRARGGPRRRVDLPSMKRVALKSLLPSARPCSIFSSEKRTSWVEDIASSPKRTASAPYWSMSVTGSMPVPSDLLIRRPSGAWMTECT
jgi:hypothetical protein